MLIFISTFFFLRFLDNEIKDVSSSPMFAFPKQTMS